MTLDQERVSGECTTVVRERARRFRTFTSFTGEKEETVRSNENGEEGMSVDGNSEDSSSVTQGVAGRK